MANISDEIIQVMNERHMSQAELSRRSGVSKSSLSRYLGGDDIPASKLKAIADALGITADELLGINSPLHLSPNERRLVDLYRKMDAQTRAKFMEMAGVFVAASEKDGAGNLPHVERVGTWVVTG